MCAVCLVIGGSALATIAGQQVDGYSTYLTKGTQLSRGVYWTGSDYRNENFMEYIPSGEVYPIVVNGSKLCSTGSFKTMSSIADAAGLHVVAGINGDYYVMANGEPLGIALENGVLRSSDGGHYAVGFKADGNVVFGKPALSISAQIGGTSFVLNDFNKTRKEGSVVLFNSDYGAKESVKGKGTEVICAVSGALTMNGNITLTVEEIIKDSEGVEIPQGKAILSVSDSSSQELLDAVNALSVGSTVTVSISSSQEWADVQYALGSLYKLVTDGKAETGLEAGAAPRTAVGKKADGTVVFYTMDGRQSGYSVGMTMTQLAQRMIELGCTEASIMDGGASTSLNAIYIGDDFASQVNKPSGGYQRAVTNYIMLVTTNKPTGNPARLGIYPLSSHLLSGAQAKFTVKAADENGYAASLNASAGFELPQGLGTISPDGLFTAGAAGEGMLKANAPGLIGAEAKIRVVETPSVLRVFKQGTSTAVTKLDLLTGASVDLLGQAMDNYVYLASKDTCYKWRVEGNIGSINEEGVFTAAADAGEGSIVVSAGETSVTIPVTVQTPGRYNDVKEGEWYYDAVEYVSEKGLMKGMADRIFAPNEAMSRAMLVTMLHRMAGSPEPQVTEGFSDVTAEQWFAKAVYWAAEKGIVQGFGGAFDPNGSVSREQLATILYRYKGSPETGADLSGFIDGASVSDWALKAMAWASEKGLIGGMGGGELAPRGSATRAQVATIFMRMDKMA